MGHYGPTQQAIEVKNQLISKIDEYINRYETIEKERLKSLNDMILLRRLEYIKVD